MALSYFYAQHLTHATRKERIYCHKHNSSHSRHKGQVLLSPLLYRWGHWGWEGKSHSQQAAKLAPESIPNTAAILPLECLWLLWLDGASCSAAWIIVQIGFLCSTHPCLCPIPLWHIPSLPSSESASVLAPKSLRSLAGTCVSDWPVLSPDALTDARIIHDQSRNWDLDSMSWKPMMLEEAKWVHDLSDTLLPLPLRSGWTEPTHQSFLCFQVLDSFKSFGLSCTSRFVHQGESSALKALIAPLHRSAIEG